MDRILVISDTFDSNRKLMESLNIRQTSSHHQIQTLGGSTRNGEHDWSPIFSDYTAGDEETIDCTLVDRALANP